MNQKDMMNPRTKSCETKIKTAYSVPSFIRDKAVPSLPLYAAQAWQGSVHDMTKYGEQHTCFGLTQTDTAFLASARLSRLLDESRKTLIGVFTVDDITLLLNCFLNEMFLPEQMCDLVPSVLDYLDANSGNSCSIESSRLINKLQNLTAVQHVAVADALEQTFYRGKYEGLSAVEVFTSMGIALLDE